MIDTEDYSAWVERLEPIAAQRVGWMIERITELERLVDVERARSERLQASLLAIKTREGQVCDNYELCQHASCQSSYASWAEADHALSHQASVSGCRMCVDLPGADAPPAPATAPDGQALPDMASTNFGLLACCRNWAWAPEMGPYVGAHHPRCPKLWAAVAPFSPLPATPPAPGGQDDATSE